MNPFKSIKKNVYVPPSSRQNKTQRIIPPPLMEEVNFPALGGNVEKNKIIKDEESSKILYSLVMNDDYEAEEVPTDLEEGWIEINKYNKNEIKKMEEEEEEEEPHPSIVFEKLASMYEEWKWSFIEVHGQEYYDYHYSMPPTHIPIPDYEDDMNSDNENENEDLEEEYMD
jgi:hypothetical protein